MKDLLDIFRQGHHEFENGRFDHIPEDSPYELFQQWMKDAVKAEELEANAFMLSTCDLKMRPSSRIVYFKDIIDHCFVFYTNYNSKKGQDIKDNPNVSMSFYWPKSARQIHIQGRCTKVSRDISDDYFNSRPRNSKIGAWASDQSEILLSREVLETKIKNLEEKYPDFIPRPEHWGGYQIEPFFFEFWQGRPSRLHDRVVFEREGHEWIICRKNP